MSRNQVFAVFGLGKFGMEICKTLSESGERIIAVDYNENTIDKVKTMVTYALQIDSTDEESLKNASLDNVDIAVVAIGDNIEASILTTTILKEKLAIPYVIARGISEIHGQILKKVGADEVIILEIDEGRRIANKLLSPHVLERIPISNNQTLAEVLIGNNFHDKTLLKLDIRNRFKVNVVSIKRNEIEIDEIGNPITRELVITPTPQQKLLSGDILVVIGRDEDINQLKG